MAKSGDRLLMGIRVPMATVKRLDKLAKALGWSRNEVAEKLLELGTSGHEWVINRLGAMVSGAAAKALGKSGRGFLESVDEEVKEKSDERD
jgi:hypothetical protein